MDYNSKESIMNKKLISGWVMSALVIISLSILIISNIANAEANYQAMYRLYNSNSGEHFYTANDVERDNLISIGWNYEGYGFIASNDGEPVYRLYNANSGDHHYTLSIGEKDSLINLGWNYEGIGWYSKSTNTTCEKVMYRLYNPNAKTATHHYTLNESEKDSLINLGWKYEGTSWTSMHNVGQGQYADSTWDQHGSSGETTCNTCGQVFRGASKNSFESCMFDLPYRPCLHSNKIYEEKFTNAWTSLNPNYIYLKSLGWFWRCPECGSHSVDGVNWMSIFEWLDYYNRIANY